MRTRSQQIAIWGIFFAVSLVSYVTYNLAWSDISALYDKHNRNALVLFIMIAGLLSGIFSYCVKTEWHWFLKVIIGAGLIILLVFVVPFFSWVS